MKQEGTTTSLVNTTRLPCVNILCKVCKDGGNITLMVHRFEIQVERIGKPNSYTANKRLTISYQNMFLNYQYGKQSQQVVEGIIQRKSE